MTWVGWVSLAAFVIAVAALWLAVHNRRALVGHGVEVKALIGAGDRTGAAATDGTDTAKALVAFVANPTKPGVPELRDAAVQACAARYLPEPL